MEPSAQPLQQASVDEAQTPLLLAKFRETLDKAVMEETEEAEREAAGMSLLSYQLRRLGLLQMLERGENPGNCNLTGLETGRMEEVVGMDV